MRWVYTSLCTQLQLCDNGTLLIVSLFLSTLFFVNVMISLLHESTHVAHTYLIHNYIHFAWEKFLYAVQQNDDDVNLKHLFVYTSISCLKKRCICLEERSRSIKGALAPIESNILWKSVQNIWAKIPNTRRRHLAMTKNGKKFIPKKTKKTKDNKNSVSDEKNVHSIEFLLTLCKPFSIRISTSSI